jgi:hypothetical protein
MTLAGSLRAGERHNPIRPIRPTIDQRQRLGVRRAGQEILARVAHRMIERQLVLARTERMAHVAA